MIVCHCHAVNDREIRQCVRDGCTSARTVSRICGAGSGCGGCMPLVKAVVQDELKRAASEVQPQLSPEPPQRLHLHLVAAERQSA